jgi:putative membrane protein
MWTWIICLGKPEERIMWKEVILAYAHFAAIFTLLWFLAKEWTLLRMGSDKLDTVALARADAGFGIAAGLVLITGISRVALGAKPASFYLHNPVFHTKVGLFVLVGLLSIWPTIVFIRWRKARDADANFRIPDADWRTARRLVMIEMHLIALIPLAAVIMARGIGYLG